jgi:hypothetical protein
VKTLSGLSGPKSLDPTKRKPISFLRKKVKRLFKKNNPSAAERSRLDELLEKAKLLSEQRHSYLHRAWSETPEGQAVLHGEGLQVEAAPSEAAIERVASDILALAKKINYASRRTLRQPHRSEVCQKLSGEFSTTLSHFRKGLTAVAAPPHSMPSRTETTGLVRSAAIATAGGGQENCMKASRIEEIKYGKMSRLELRWAVSNAAPCWASDLDARDPDAPTD